MEEAFIRAELFIKALQNCSPSTRAADVKAYVTALEKELKIIKREAQNASLFTSEQDKWLANHPTQRKFGPLKTSLTLTSKVSPPIPPPEEKK